ncbi:efflux RND transporter permease subunit [bacterium]|nr:efflux RND transporter permease subunit [candidate division CSSED10-310 bacterium]
MSIPAFAVKRPVTIVMLFVGVLLFGALSFTKLPIDLYPEIELPTITVATVYPGASALEVEEKVTQLVEDTVSVISGIKQVTSKSTENISSVRCEFHYGTDLDEAAAEIRANLEFLTNDLPEDADSPMVIKINTSMIPVVMMGIYSDTGDIFADYDLAEDLVVDRLKSREGVGSVMVFNATPQRVEIRLERRRMELLGLSINEIAAAIQHGNVSAPAGNMEVGIADYSLQLKGEFRSLQELRELVVGMGGTGGLVRLDDVAEVLTSYPELTEEAAVDDRPCLFMMVNKRSGANTVQVAEAVKREIDKINEELPPGMHTKIVYDLSNFIVNMIDNLTRTVILGGIFVIVIVLLFLRRLRSSIIIAISIPASLIAAFGGLALFDYTINMFSLMSMAVAIGMVVDNAIVVLENISRHMEEGEDRRRASSIGGTEVSAAVFASTLTSVSIFGPLVFVSGFVGVLFKQLAFVVVIVLVASLMASLLLTPALAGWFLRVTRRDRRHSGGLGGETRYASVYGSLIGRALRHPWLVVAGAMGLLIATVLTAGQLNSGFMPKQDVGDITLNIELPVGTATSETARVARQIQDILQREFGQYVTLRYYRAGSSAEGMAAVMGERQGSHIAELGVHLVPVDKRPLTTHEMAEKLRPLLSEIPEITSFSITSDSPLAQIFTGGEKPLTIRLKGTDLEILKQATLQVEQAVAAIPGTVEIARLVPEDRPEVRVSVDRLRASRLGVPIAVAAEGLRSAFYGEKLGTYRTDGTEMDLYLRFQKADRSTIQDMLEIPVRGAGGELIRLRNLARIEEGITPLEIQRVDQQRATIVQGDVSGRSLGEVTADMQESLKNLDLGRGVTVEFGGNIEESAKTSRDFLLVLILGIALVYMVMAAQFESFLDPFVIMLSVPFAFTGVFLLLFITGTDLNVPAFMGLIMLMGIVVNNAIVLLDYVKQLQAGGMPLIEAIVTGGSRRLRPVLMTTATTICGMLPMAMAGGEGHEMWRPMGIAVIGGLLLSTLVTLILVPVVYALVDKLRTPGTDAHRDTVAPARHTGDPVYTGGL